MALIWLFISLSVLLGLSSSQNDHHFHAPARPVRVPSGVDPVLKRRFLELFHRANHPTHPHDNSTDNSESYFPTISPEIINEINADCPRDAFFYSFADRHVRAVEMLRGEFMARRTAQEVYDLARSVLYRHEVNDRVWYYALHDTLLKKPELNGYFLAWPVDATPDLYITAPILGRATQGTKRPLPIHDTQQCRSGARKNDVQSSSEGFQEVNQQSGQRTCYRFDGSQGATSAEENRLWYWREDIMVNEQHWYWHRYFPLRSPTRTPDRRGESFFFFHHNLIARYNAERLSNGLPIVEALDLRLNGNIGVGYNSRLVDSQSQRFWSSRPANTRLSHINHAADSDFELDVDMNELEGFHKRLISHVRSGYLLANRTLHGQPNMVFKLNITNMQGVNHLGNTMEASDVLSTFADYYSATGVHNLGHIVIGLSTDPDYSGRCPPSGMADLSVTIRDPAFFKIHTLVDDMYDLHKRSLPPHLPEGGDWPLMWHGIRVRTVTTIGQKGGRRNHLNTFWSTRRFPIEEGIDGKIHEGDVAADVCQTYLNHEPFRFEITAEVSNRVKVEAPAKLRGTMRIFMAPRFNVDGERFQMNDTRRLMFQLDHFPVELKHGRNLITRNSQDSSSTKPWSRTLKEMLQNPDNSNEAEYCGCGWPSHMYLPKGTTQGMKFDLFAMITNFDDDQVFDTPEDLAIQEPCNSAYLLCGIPYRKYPDARPQGYPFDRMAFTVYDGYRYRAIRYLEEYSSYVSNMNIQTVIVQHTNRLVE